MPAVDCALTVLAEADWLERQHAHEAHVRQWTDPHQARAARHEKHPVYDFLFNYYAFRPAWLRRWHPGPDVALEGNRAHEFLRWSEYCETPKGVMLNVGALKEHRLKFVRWLRDLILATDERPAFFGCYGMHEWAMVYRQTQDEVRHNAWPLRYSPKDLARIVEATPLRCTHYDAFRFFTAPARPLNKIQPTRDTMDFNEQRGCLHANMDLYKWATKLAPFTPAQLTLDCFGLARDIREVDMRASPYDLRNLGFEPITVETEAGRAEYEEYQRNFVERAQPLRAHLLSLCERLLQGF